MGSVVPGLTAAAFVALIGDVIGSSQGVLASASATLLAGILAGSALHRHRTALAPGVAFGSQRILQVGIVLLGLGISMSQVFEIGIPAFIVIAIAMVVAGGVTLGCCRVLGLRPAQAVLLAVGTAVCGNSAIVATAPLVRATHQEISYAMAAVTLYGTVAVILLPLVGTALGLSSVEFGLWAGAGINDTSQVIAAASSFSGAALTVATVVKLVRNALLAPLLMLVAAVWKVADRSQRSRMRKAIPLFVLGFLALSAMRSVGAISTEVATNLEAITRACVLVGVGAVGLSVDLQNIGRGHVAVGVGIACGAVVGVVALGATWAFSPALLDSFRPPD